MKLGILNEFNGLEENYIKACKDLGINYEVIDVLSSDWINNVLKSNCDGFLVRPSCGKTIWKTMFDEKLYFISEELGLPIYPSYKEILIYENKRNMASWLEINNVNHAKTWSFFTRQEALDFFTNYDEYPLIFKPNLGSAAIGIKIIKNKEEGIRLTKKIFTKGRFFSRGYTKWSKTKIGLKYPNIDDKQYNSLMVQQYIDVSVEWRMIKIGDSYFGHQKLEKDGFCSGSGRVGWVRPPEQLLNMLDDICEKGGFNSMDVDIFEDVTGRYYVNELQTIFGSYDNSQMYIDGKPGRFIKHDGKWVFEEGYFNLNGSCNLRVENFINILSGAK